MDGTRLGEKESLVETPAHLSPSEDALAQMSRDERSKLALEAKTIGNKCFTSKKYEKAIELYSKAIQFFPDPIYYSNRAACYASLNDFEHVVHDCNEALKLDPGYIKALTRRARAYENLGKELDALNDYTAVCVLEEFKNESSLAATDRFLKQISTKKTEEILKVGYS